jgi:hypothetical protein
LLRLLSVAVDSSKTVRYRYFFPGCVGDRVLRFESDGAQNATKSPLHVAVQHGKR